MLALQAHLLRFVVEATSPIHLRGHKGSAIRGAFFHALRGGFCTFPSSKSCRECSLWATCPVCFLVASLDESSERGQDVPRPYVVRPPVDSREVYNPGDGMEFGITLFSRALNLFPYVIVAVSRMGELGLGATRGRFRVREVWAENPLTGIQHRLHQSTGGFETRHHISVPDIPVTHGQIVEGAGSRDKGIGLWGERGLRIESRGLRIAVRLRTPLRLTSGGELVHRLGFATFVRRLLERISSLSGTYAHGSLDVDFQDLLRRAESVEVVEDHTRWVEVSRYSSRQSRTLPMGGLVGEITFAGDLGPFLPWLMWGTLTHVGKYAVLGNGWYEMEVLS